MDINVTVKWDEDAQVYYAVNEISGLALESESYDKLIDRVTLAIPELLELNNITDVTSINFVTENRCLDLEIIKKNANYLAKLDRGIEQIKSGNLQYHELIEVDD